MNNILKWMILDNFSENKHPGSAPVLYYWHPGIRAQRPFHTAFPYIYIFIVIHNFCDLKSLANNAKIWSSLNFFFYCRWTLGFSGWKFPIYLCMYSVFTLYHLFSNIWIQNRSTVLLACRIRQQLGLSFRWDWPVS